MCLCLPIAACIFFVDLRVHVTGCNFIYYTHKLHISCTCIFKYKNTSIVYTLLYIYTYKHTNKQTYIVLTYIHRIHIYLDWSSCRQGVNMYYSLRWKRRRRRSVMLSVFRDSSSSEQKMIKIIKVWSDSHNYIAVCLSGRNVHCSLANKERPSRKEVYFYDRIIFFGRWWN